MDVTFLNANKFLNLATNMPNEKKTPLKRKFLSIELKIQILDRLQNQERISDIARHFNLNESTIRTIKQNEEKIRSSVASGSSVVAKVTARPRPQIMEKMEQSLMVWIEDMTKKRLPLDGNVIKHKALKIFNYLKETGQSSIDEDNHQFVASNGWFGKFKKRHALHNLKIQGESASADADAAEKYPAEFEKIIKQNGYLPEQVFNADETGLWWKKMPSRTFISKNEKRAPGFKVSKDRVTLLLCSNASGDFMTKPMFINRSLNPRCMKQCNKNNLPVYWRANKKSWMTASLFNDWFYHCFVPDVENYLKKNNLAFKVLLLLDNAPSHSTDLSHSNVQIEFLPPNTTSLLQPLDQGIIAVFKAYYIRKSFEVILEKMESANITVKEVWKQFTILNSVEIVDASLKEIRPSTLKACWKALIPEIDVQSTVSTPIEDEYRNIVRLAHAVEGDGFDEITMADIQELIADDEINEADLVAMTNEESVGDSSDDLSDVENKNFSLKNIEKVLNMAKQLEEYILENDPLSDRAEIFKRNLQNNLAPYQEIYKDLRNKSKQTSMHDFFKPIIVEKMPESDSGSSSKRSKQIILSDEEE